MVTTKKKLVMMALAAGVMTASCPAFAADDTQNGVVKNQFVFAQQALKEIQENSQLVQDLRAQLDQNIADNDATSDFPFSIWEDYEESGDYNGALFQGVLYTLEEKADGILIDIGTAVMRETWALISVPVMPHRAALWFTEKVSLMGMLRPMATFP